MIIEFRSTSAADDEFLFQLFVSAKGEDLSSLPPDQQQILLKMQFEAQRRGYNAQFPESEASLILLEQSPIGLLWLSETAEEIRIVDLAILPDFRNRGSGSTALSRVIGQADRAGKRVALTVGTNNPKAARLYERLGFRVRASDAIFLHMERLQEGTAISVPDPSLILLIGAAGSGKSSFARKHFKPTEILSSDFCRGLVSDDENDQSATADAFEVLRFIAAKRLGAKRLTVIDATNVQREARERSLQLAREFQLPAVAIVLNLDDQLCMQRNQDRQERTLTEPVIQEQLKELRNSVAGLQEEGFAYVYVLNSAAAVENARIERLATPRDSSELPS